MRVRKLQEEYTLTILDMSALPIQINTSCILIQVFKFREAFKFNSLKQELDPGTPDPSD